MKKLLCLLAALMLLMDSAACAEAPAYSLNLNREVTADDYAGSWKLVAAYSAADGFLPVTEDVLHLDMEATVKVGELVSTKPYEHADVTNLTGALNVNDDSLDADPFKVTAHWDEFGSGRDLGASKCKVRGDDDMVFFKEITGVELDTDDMINTLGITADGDLILGYSDGDILTDDAAGFVYAYIFERVEE